MGELVSLMDLWLPIVVSAVIVFVASFIAWVVSPHHKPDFRQLPDEDAFLATLRAQKPPPGQYMFPYCGDPSELKDPEKKKKYDAGPHGWMAMWPGPPNMGKNMALSLLFYLVTGLFVAYIGTLSLHPGAPYLKVFQVCGTAAIMAHCFAFIPTAIWFGKPLRATAMDVIDGVVYGLLTAGTFGWLWPAGEAGMGGVPGMS